MPQPKPKENFTCMRCGSCCRWQGYVRLSDGEILRISEYMGFEAEEFTRTFTRLTEDRRSLSLIEKEDGSCIFLAPDSGYCIINTVKPEQCVSFPLKWNFEGWRDLCSGGRQSQNKSGG